MSILAILAFLWAGMGASESFWLDELHTAWVLTGDWTEIASRASAGNQSPVYFYFQAALQSTVGSIPDGSTFAPPEVSLRLPSMICWALAVGIVAWLLLRNARSPWRVGLAVALCLCLFIDHLQVFYAGEARTYAVVQLFSLLNWVLVSKAISQCCTTCPGALSHWRWLVWLGSAAATLSLHITSGPAVMAQWLVLSAVVGWRRCNRVAWLLTSLGLAVFSGVMLTGAQPVWQRRQQWASFAGDASVSSIVQQFPMLVAALSIVLLAFVMTYLCPLKSSDETLAAEMPCGSSWFDIMLKPRISILNPWFWACAALIPIAVAWVITRIGIAPVFHYRFMIASALPLYLWAGLQTLNLRPAIVGWLVLVGVFAWMAFSQGTIGSWQHGAWPHAMRGEGWRQAVQYVTNRFDPDHDELWCYAGLIEGRDATLPLSAADSEYLSYPLRGCYEVALESLPIEPRALIGNSRLWVHQMRTARDQHLRNFSPANVWIVCRGTSETMVTRLQSADLQDVPQKYPITEFGRVCVVCLELSVSHVIK